ncbi:MAG: hypothetical protein PHI04_09480 [Clostridiaceae bacterium]|nr:hypothetical protein [Clostridiaceae bacterium]
MNYIFYTSQGYTIAPDDSDVENLQVLGIESGDTYDAAFISLIANNAWIVEKGYCLSEIMGKALVSVL